MDEPQGRPLVYAFSLWGPLLLGGTYGVAWSLLSNTPGVYRPVLGLVSAMFITVSLASITRALRQWRRRRRQPPLASTNEPRFWGSGLNGPAKWIRVTGQAGMVLGGVGLAASFRSLVDERKDLALLLVICAVALLAFGVFLYWLSYKLAEQRGQGDSPDADIAPGS